MSDQIKVQRGDQYCVPVTSRDAQYAVKRYHSGKKLSRSVWTIISLMLAGFCLLITVGCNDRRHPEPLENAFTVTVESVNAKQTETIASIESTRQEIVSQNQQILDAVKDLSSSILETRRAVGTMEASLTAPKSQTEEVIKSALEPQEAPRANPSQAHQPVASPPVVRLYVTSSENCAPCVRLWNAVERGEFAGFDVIKSQDFDGLRSYPAIRFQDGSGQWKVLYGYDETTVETLRRLTSTNRFVSHPVITKSFVSQPDLVSIHNSLHGGGNWNWPGDLATHLREVHGYGIQTQSAPLVNRGSSCPSGNCPTPRSLKMRWGR